MTIETTVTELDDTLIFRAQVSVSDDLGTDPGELGRFAVEEAVKQIRRRQDEYYGRNMDR